MKALGLNSVATYILTLITTYNLALLFISQGDIDKAKVIYLRALIGY